MRENLTVARPTLGGSGMPITVERANLQRPHAKYDMLSQQTLTRLAMII